jgi:cystathionine beta-lyase/cystathionine gamma-synthase
MNPHKRVHSDAQRIPDGLIRLSIGLEGAEVLLDDLHVALRAVV